MSAGRRRIFGASFVLALLGAAVAGVWLYFTRGGEAFGVLARVRADHAAALLAITAIFVGVRFVRWQYLLRRVEVGVPTRESLRVYLASLVGTATPGYVGEAVRCAFLKRRCGSPLRRTLLCLVVERLLDVMTLGLIGALCPGPTLPRVLMGAAVPVSWILIPGGRGRGEPGGERQPLGQGIPRAPREPRLVADGLGGLPGDLGACDPGALRGRGRARLRAGLPVLGARVHEFHAAGRPLADARGLRGSRAARRSCSSRTKDWSFPPRWRR
jgi:hypothetical protein